MNNTTSGTEAKTHKTHLVVKNQSLIVPSSPSKNNLFYFTPTSDQRKSTPPMWATDRTQQPAKQPPDYKMCDKSECSKLHLCPPTRPDFKP